MSRSIFIARVAWLDNPTGRQWAVMTNNCGNGSSIELLLNVGQVRLTVVRQCRKNLVCLFVLSGLRNGCKLSFPNYLIMFDVLLVNGRRQAACYILMCV